MATEEKEPYPGARTRGLCSNMEFHELPTWPQFFVSADHGSSPPVTAFLKLCSYRACTSYTLTCIILTDNVQRDRYSALSSTSGLRAHTHASCLLSIPSHRSSPRGPKWLQQCGPPMIISMVIGDKESWPDRGSHGWNSMLEHSLQSPLSSSYVVSELVLAYVLCSNTNSHQKCTLRDYGRQWKI